MYRIDIFRGSKHVKTEFDSFGAALSFIAAHSFTDCTAFLLKKNIGGFFDIVEQFA